QLTAAGKVTLFRCPSDDFDPDALVSNYAGSLGPQCAIGPCGFDPHQQFCTTAWANANNAGYTTSPDHGNSFSASAIRRMFTRLGAKITFGMVKDGLSNTIMVGESLPQQHDHLTNGGWWGFNYGASHVTTIIPINYDSHFGDTWCSPADHYRGNWDVSWGFK